MLTRRFGKLIVVERDGSDKWGNAVWLCRCDCGGNVSVPAHRLKIGKTKSCGCINTGTPTKDLTGKTFHRLTVLSYEGKDKFYGSMWRCICECGTFTIVRRSHLVKGMVKSCGCYKQEIDKSRTGTHNPNYNPLLTNEDRQDRRFNVKIKEWSKQIKEQYNFCCDVCMTYEHGKLVSHHLFNYRDYPELRLDLQNGVCLCSTCHRLFHKTYGYKYNTKTQYLEFKEQHVQL